jgi:negative regulator of flagellin synthesis FlgM
MKIDPRTQLPSETQPPPVKNSRNTGAAPNSKQSSGVKPATGEDTVRISSTHSDVQTLKANLANVPEVRVDRVNALQQQVNSGHYKPDSQKVADAIIADQSHLNTTA